MGLGDGDSVGQRWYWKWVSQIMGRMMCHREDADPTDNLNKKESKKFRSEGLSTVLCKNYMCMYIYYIHICMYTYVHMYIIPIYT